MAEPTQKKLIIPESVMATIMKRRRSQAEDHIADADPLLKSLVAASPQEYARKIIPGLIPMGFYRGVRDIHEATDRTQRLLRQMAETFAVRLILNTRALQAKQFFRPPSNERDNGLRLRMRDRSTRPTPGDRERMAEIEDVLFNGAVLSRRPSDGALGRYSGDFLEEAWPLWKTVGAMVYDTYPLDCCTVWKAPGRDKQKQPVAFYKPLDPTLIRPAQKDIPKEYLRPGDQVEPYKAEIRPELNPVEYVMFDPNSREPIMEFGAGEMDWLTRNTRSVWHSAGYGYSELESLVQIVTGVLNAATFNSSYFSENHVPPAIVYGSGDFSGEHSQYWLSDFLQTLTSMVDGTSKHHKMPILFGPEGANLNLLPLRDFQQDDMKFKEFSLFFFNVLLGSFSVAAEEVGFQSYLTRGGQLGASGGAERVATAQSIGLRALLDFFLDWTNRSIVSPFYAEDDGTPGPYVAELQNIDSDDIAQEQRMALERLNSGFTTLNEERAATDRQPYRDPVNRDLWEAIEKRAVRLQPRLENMPIELDQVVAKVYSEHGGEFRQWPDMPLGSAAMARQQELAGEEWQPGPPDMGAAMGLPPGMLPGPQPQPEPADNSAEGIEKSLAAAVQSARGGTVDVWL